ncbi:MAG: HAMP domain-containing histidine kinase [Ruminococcus sp.]|nr:HAMP domain-containing histidine kinase [Ruminococcus sp.]
MSRLIGAFLAFALMIVSLGAAAVYRSRSREDPSGGYAVELNGIENLIRQGRTDEAAVCAEELRQEIRNGPPQSADGTVTLMCTVCLVFLCAVSGYCYVVIIRPFHKLSDFAEKVARGELDSPLEYRRANWFGKFTWAFDSMRKEILRARSCEREAIENNKTVIAAISHDIKTPVASIRAYAEALSLGMDGGGEKRDRYISVIMRKCDEVSKLTDDMLTHSLSDLNKLKMSPENFELCGFMEEVTGSLDGSAGDIRLEKPSYFLDIYADKGRCAQIVENLVTNSRKYAHTPIVISLSREERSAVMRFRDLGPGIPDEDMPFVLGKFYRGRNSSSEKGAGLGLYIVSYIAEQSGGEVSLKNCSPGLEVTVKLPIARESGSVS